MTPDTVVRRSLAAGGADDFMTAHHLVLRGSQRAIGQALAAEAQAEFPPVPGPEDPALNRARRRWIERNWPQHYERMSGIADALGVDLLDDHTSVADLFATPFRAGCSALWCPADAMIDGRTRIGRNFDFWTGSVLEVAGASPDPTQPPMMARPYVIETYPDGGLASVVVAACDLAGCFEGINETGLTVALFADDESTNLRPTNKLQAGLHELQVPRFLLDTCSTVVEAVDALYSAKQYDNMVVCHYLIADAHGDAFVWERDTHNAEHVVWAGGAPMCVTNHLLHRHDGADALPEHDRSSAAGEIPFRHNTYERARTLDRRAAGPPLSRDDLREAMNAVRVDGGAPVARTLWCTLYDLEERSLTVEFYLGDEADGSPRRSSPATYAVERRRQ